MKRITKEDRETIATVCPKFNRICACYVNNPEYGVTLSPKAKRALNTANNAVKRSPKNDVVSVRLTKEDIEIIERYGSTMSEAIRTMIRTVDR